MKTWNTPLLNVLSVKQTEKRNRKNRGSKKNRPKS
jgi:hypothetical protein